MTLSMRGKMQVREKVCRRVGALIHNYGLMPTAKALGQPRSTVMRWRDGLWPSYAAARRLCPLLGLDPDSGLPVNEPGEEYVKTMTNLYDLCEKARVGIKDDVPPPVMAEPPAEIQASDIDEEDDDE